MKTIVVGAGGGGIASALLSAKRNEEVLLLESHSKLGGCASYFRRGKYVFDAGATTLSGVGVGEPLGKLFEILGHAPELYASDPGIVFHLSSGKKISYHRDFEKWMKELEENFPGLCHRKFWKKVIKMSEKSWRFLDEVKAFPLEKFSDLFSLIKYPQYLSLFPYLFISTDEVLKFHSLDTTEYLELINGMLLISAQAESPSVPFLIGAMGLSYPRDTYAPKGGMKGLMDFFEKEMKDLGVELKNRTRVQSFEDKKVTTKNEESYSGDRVILNLPVWNLARMTSGSRQKRFSQEAKKRPGSWGAYTLYFGVKGREENLYHQVHLNHPMVKNYFVSFSHPDDESRAPKGEQAVTISTHVMVGDEPNRQALTELIINDFKQRFSRDELFFVTTGMPKTFERYTGRLSGFVGGIPFLRGQNPFKIPGYQTQEKALMRVGDTVFPGQGLCGVVAGALKLHERLYKKH